MGLLESNAHDAIDATGILGGSESTTRLRAEIAKAAPFSSNVLITGASGTGKELVARAIHSLSPRANELFIPVDCASLFGEMMASQLFGHEAGAFTGASYAALGCFRAAHRGTIFLDEIGEMELPLQAKLLRVIQERVVMPVGSHQGVDIDVRIVAATNRDLQGEAAAGRFREDLFFRLNVVSIQTTPLRDRPADIEPLANQLLADLAAHGLPRRQLSPGSLAALTAYAWPGNVRQLKNVLEQAVITSDTPLLTVELIKTLLDDRPAGIWHQAALPPPQFASADTLRGESHEMREPQGFIEKAPVDDAHWPTLGALERDHIVDTLEHTYYNRSAAARLLGISRQALVRKIAKYKIAVPRKGH